MPHHSSEFSFSLPLTFRQGISCIDATLLKLIAVVSMTADHTSLEARSQYGTVSDISYYLELAAGETFRDMDPERQTSLLVEYEDLLDDYSLIAREIEDGETAYIVGQYNGDPTESPLYGMYSIEVSPAGEGGTFQFLYREEHSETVDAVLSANNGKFPQDTGYRIEASQIYWSANSGLILIQPKDNALFLDVPWNRYLHTPNGREYIVDAVSRGIDVCGRTDTFLYVYLMHYPPKYPTGCTVWSSFGLIAPKSGSAKVRARRTLM